MASGTVRVLARFRARSGKSQELRDVLLTLVEPTCKETGCIRYELWQNEADDHELTFVEEWTSEAALASHLETAHIRKAREGFTSLIDGEVDLGRYRVVP